MENKILVTNIQRFSLYDGPGIRTTIFLKGCSIRCPWCSNPENLSKSIQNYMKNGTKGVYGKYYSPESLYKEILKDKTFYGEYNFNNDNRRKLEIELLPGGVTFSGGECLLQIDALLPLLEILKYEQIHMAIETSLFVPEDYLFRAIEYINFYYVDIKILNREKCLGILSGDIELFMKNADILLYSGKSVVLRIPVIGGYTDNIENRNDIFNFISKYIKSSQVNILGIELIKEHNLGIEKYKSLSVYNKGYKEPVYSGITDIFMEQYKKELEECIGKKIPVKICSIG